MSEGKMTLEERVNVRIFVTGAPQYGTGGGNTSEQYPQNRQQAVAYGAYGQEPQGSSKMQPASYQNDPTPNVPYPSHQQYPNGYQDYAALPSSSNGHPTNRPIGFAPQGYGAPPPYSPDDYQPKGRENPQENEDEHVMGGYIVQQTTMTFLATSKISDCTDAGLRNGFISKVYGLLFLELLITFGVVAVCTFVPRVKQFVSGTTEDGDYDDDDDTTWWQTFVAAFGTFLLVYIIIMVSKTARRRVPYNYIFITLFALSMGYILGYLASFFDTYAVVQAMGACAVVCFLMTFYGCQESIPLGGCFIFMFIIFVPMICFGIMSIFAFDYLMTNIYASLAAALFSIVLLIDTYLIVHGGRHEIIMEEYVFCSLILYLDVINVFLFILMILGGGSRN